MPSPGWLTGGTLLSDDDVLDLDSSHDCSSSGMATALRKAETFLPLWDAPLLSPPAF